MERTGRTTIKETLKRIRALGLTAAFDSALQEFRIDYRNAEQDTAYFTDDREDAMATALHMAKGIGR